MKLLFHLAHPSHFQIYRLIFLQLKEKQIDFKILINKKDILEQLLIESDFPFQIVGSKNEKNLKKIGSFLEQFKKVNKVCNKFKPTLLIGTSAVLGLIGRKKNIPFINLVEDDAKIIPWYAYITFPFSTVILAPNNCDLGKWNTKKVGYDSYHELAFLHPNHFAPNKEIAAKYVDVSADYFIVRLTAFNAHHDNLKKGISNSLLNEIIKKLEKKGPVYISSEKQIPKEFSAYELKIKALDIHHVLAFATILIGDSQSMAMEAACLGVPSIRLNDYAGKISVLNELEEKYLLTHAYLSHQKNDFLLKLDELIHTENLIETYQQRRDAMLAEKINFNKFLVDYIINFSATNKSSSLKKNNNTIKLVALFYVLTLVALFLIPFNTTKSINTINVFSFRLDHLIHSLVFIPIPLLFAEIIKGNSKTRFIKVLLLSLTLALALEVLHLFLSYRAFTLPDLLANLLGVTIGIFILSFLKVKKVEKNK